VSTNRLEAFSDGVIAIAITLLVLDIKVPDPNATSSLEHALGEMWPNYAAYVVSFLTIGIIWINHHALVRRLREADHSVLLLNLFLLLTIGVLPFTTALLAAYIGEDGEHLAAAVYAGSLLAMAFGFLMLQRRILFSGSHLLHDHITEEDRDLIWRRNRAGVVPYAVAVAIAPISAYATLILCALIAVFYAKPATTSV
jgi:uncharacterized membrane protein